MRRSLVALLLSAATVAAVTGCSATSGAAADRPVTPAAQATTAPPTSPASRRAPQRAHHRHARPAPTSVPSVRAFRFSTAGVTSASLGRSWRPGCPVGPSSLAALTMSFWGFDNRPHTGTLVVNRSVVTAVVTAFRSMYDARFPIRRMQPVATYGGSDNRSMNADNTSAFNCRYAVSNGPKSWSMHAYGEAVDVDPLENPYRLDDKVLPPAGTPYMDRSHVRPGMVVAGSSPTRAFAAIGWGWGGSWSSTPDYQHFSTNGR
jgi:hypothetical protein